VQAGRGCKSEVPRWGNSSSQPSANIATFTNHCDVGLVLTLRWFRRRLELSRAWLAVVAVASEMPNAHGRGRAIPAASGSVKTGPGIGMQRAGASLNPGQAKPETGGSLMEVTPPEDEAGFA
jgi:hypothetical protein